jgi:amino acid transporter
MSSTDSSEPGSRSLGSQKIVVATTVALAFISFWRGAAIVLSDMASSAFYAGGIAEQAIGKSAPFFVLGVMLFSFAVRSVYLESCGMFVRGGVYVVVRDSMGPFMARLSVSALVFDYILTGPISAVSAGQYLGHLLNEISELAHQKYMPSIPTISPRCSECSSRLTSGGATLRAFMSPAGKRCASCRSPLLWWRPC